MFIVVEIQRSETTSTIVNSYEVRADADSKYHAILSAAAISKVPIHGAIMFTAEGYFIKSESFKHEPEEE